MGEVIFQNILRSKEVVYKDRQERHKYKHKHISNHLENYHIVYKVKCNYIVHDNKKKINRGLIFKGEILNLIIANINSIHCNIISSTM